MATTGLWTRLALPWASKWARVPVRHHTGYIPFEGRKGRDRNTISDKILDQTRAINLQPVVKIQCTFDPIEGHAFSIRHFMWLTSLPKIRKTNNRVIFKTQVVSDRSEPVIRVELAEGRSLVYRTARMSVLDILYHFNKVVLPLVQKPDTNLQSKGTRIPLPKQLGKKRSK